MGAEFKILREHEPVSAATARLIDQLQEAFALTLSILKESPIVVLPETATDEQLQQAIGQLVQVGIGYLELAKLLPE